MAKLDKSFLKSLKPVDVRNMSTKEMRSLYSNLRGVANKRIGRLAGSGMGQGLDFFKTLKHIATGDFPALLMDVVKFVASDKNTVRGRRKEYNDFVEMMNEKGYEGIVNNYEDFIKFTKYMDSLRERYSSKLFDSGNALDVFQQGQRLNISREKLIKHYDLFATNLDALEDVKPSKDGKEFSQARINTLIKKWK